MLAAGCWLLVAAGCCLLLPACYWCLLAAAGCWQLLAGGCWLLAAACCCWLLAAGCCWVPAVACWLLAATGCSLLAAAGCCLPLASCMYSDIHAPSSYNINSINASMISLHVLLMLDKSLGAVSEGSGSDVQDGNDSCSSSEDEILGKEDSKNDSQNASLPSLGDSSTNTNSSTQFPEYGNTAQTDYDFIGDNTPLFFEGPSKATNHPKASIDSTNLPAPHQLDMKHPKVLLRLKTLLNDRPGYQQAMANAWSRTASDFSIKSTTQLNAQATIKWINEFENIRRKEPGLIK